MRCCVKRTVRWTGSWAGRSRFFGRFSGPSRSVRYNKGRGSTHHYPEIICVITRPSPGGLTRSGAAFAFFLGSLSTEIDHRGRSALSCTRVHNEEALPVHLGASLHTCASRSIHYIILNLYDVKRTLTSIEDTPVDPFKGWVPLRPNQPLPGGAS